MSRLVRNPTRCKAEQHISRIDLVTAEMLAHPGTADGAQNDGEECSQFDDAISPRESPLGKQLGQQAILGGAEERGLTKDQSQRRQRQPKRVRRQSGRSQPASIQTPSPLSRASPDAC